MFPEVILDLIDSYVAAMDEGSDLPSLRAVQKLVKRTDLFVIWISKVPWRLSVLFST